MEQLNAVAQVPHISPLISWAYLIAIGYFLYRGIIK